MASDLTRFDLAEMLRCGKAIRAAAMSAKSMEGAAQQVCLALYDELRVGTTTTSACVLVRCYKTHCFGDLGVELQAFARKTLGDVAPKDSMKCLVLLGTAGKIPAWRSRRRSNGHQAIALPSKDIVERAPMIAQLFAQLGVPIEHVISPSPDVVRQLAGKTYGVFHIENAVGSPFIPAQEGFVIPYGVRSVVGFGGGLTNGDLFAVVLFANVPISPQVADRFRALALDAKGAFFRFTESQVFDRTASV